MELLIEKLPYILGAGVLLGLLIVWELKFPEVEIENNVKKRSYLTNTLILLTNNAVFFAFSVTTIYTVAYSYRLHDWWEYLPMLGQVVGGVIVLDFVVWLWHWLSHNNNLLWRFHQAHHSEIYLNATSAIRFHVGELFLSLLFKAGFLMLLGIPFWVFLLNEILITVFAAFHHSNMQLSPRVQSVLEKIIITPDLHRVHHSTERFQHDTNYGVIFSWWDRLLKTRLVAPIRVYGLKGIGEKNFIQFLVFPFLKK